MTKPSVDRFDLVEARRHFHRHPEAGFCEFQTAAHAIELLKGWGYEIAVGAQVMDPDSRLGVPNPAQIERAWERAVEAGYDLGVLERMRDGLAGAVATITGRAAQPGPTTRVVALRADMDALPILESAADSHRPTALGFASQYPGTMHACGHDGHVAMGLEVSRRLAGRAGEWCGEFRLILQPAEEGLRGARAMAMGGAVDRVDDMVCVHLGATAPSGVIHTAVKGVMASVKMRATFTGRASHAALAPEQGRSALLAAAAAALAVHTTPQNAAAVTRVNVGAIRSGEASNVVPASAVLTLEARGDDTEACDALVRRIRNALEGSAMAYEVGCQIETIGQAPAVRCSTSLAVELANSAPAIDGLRVSADPLLDTASDDAAWLINEATQRGGRGTYMLVGSDLPSGHHTPEFDIDESMLHHGVDMLEESILALLSSES